MIKTKIINKNLKKYFVYNKDLGVGEVRSTKLNLTSIKNLKNPFISYTVLNKLFKIYST